MINYGSGPDLDELEISVFGPGYGEAIAVHLGEEKWILVDSCINPEVKIPASLHYLNEIKVKPDSVKSIIASHWHDDHVRGISALASAYPLADFIISNVFNEKEMIAFLDSYSDNGITKQTGEPKS